MSTIAYLHPKMINVGAGGFSGCCFTEDMFLLMLSVCVKCILCTLKLQKLMKSINQSINQSNRGL